MADLIILSNCRPYARAVSHFSNNRLLHTAYANRVFAGKVTLFLLAMCHDKLFEQISLVVSVSYLGESHLLNCVSVVCRGFTWIIG